MNYDIAVSMSDTLNIKVLDTQTFDIYDRTFTKIEEITKFNGISLTHAYNLIDSFFNRKNPNIVVNIDKSKDDENMYFSLTYTKKDDFNITFDILLLFELDKQTIDDMEKKYNQLLYKIAHLEATMNNMTKRQDCAEICIRRKGGYIAIPQNTTKLDVKNVTPTNIEGYDDTINTLFLNSINSLINFGGVNIEELNITGNFSEIKIRDIPTLKKLSCTIIGAGTIPLELNGSFVSLEELSLINWPPSLKTIKDKLPKQKIKIILQNIGLDLYGEIPTLKELGHTVECKP